MRKGVKKLKKAYKGYSDTEEEGRFTWGFRGHYALLRSFESWVYDWHITM
ncbi:hypothetical protein BC938DRAFT_472025, partial [Jimgerdemannia flammicorona]